MGRDLKVYYYSNSKIASNARRENHVEEYDRKNASPEELEKDKLYWEAHEMRSEFSENGARNWDLDWNDHFSGTCKELKQTIINLLLPQNNQNNQSNNSESESESDDDINFEAIGNLAKILSECPWKNGYIVIEND